jgi:hypothetical protein
LDTGRNRRAAGLALSEDAANFLLPIASDEG